MLYVHREFGTFGYFNFILTYGQFLNMTAYRKNKKYATLSKEIEILIWYFYDIEMSK